MNEDVTVRGYHPVPLRQPNTHWLDEQFLKPEPWMGDAKCRESDPDLFFPEYHGGSHSYLVDKVKRMCRACPVRAECLKYALDHDERYGIWGGFTQQERNNIRKARA